MLIRFGEPVFLLLSPNGVQQLVELRSGKDGLHGGHGGYLMHSMKSLSLLMDVGWTLATLSAVTGATMVVVGLFEELPGIIRSAFRSAANRP